MLVVLDTTDARGLAEFCRLERACLEGFAGPEQVGRAEQTADVFGVVLGSHGLVRFPGCERWSEWGDEDAERVARGVGQTRAW